jgi:phage tail-like protein
MTVADKPAAVSGVALEPLEPAAAGPLALRPAAPQPLAVAHVASKGRCYPGESVTLFTQVEARARLPGFSVQISVPPGLQAGAYRASPNHGSAEPELIFADEGRYLHWQVTRPVATGETFNYELEVTARPTQHDIAWLSRALARPAGDQDDNPGGDESVEILVSAAGRYLRYLPRVYQEQDEVMGRFLMLFESFWAPIESQIDNIPLYFDPAITPLKLLPWLATWVDLTLDDHWPEAKRRQLLKAAVSLYRKRGTKRGLQEYLEIYTGAQVQISEHGAHNFLLGPDARLGPGVALGTVNMPHTFTVTVYLPPPAEGAVVTAAERQRYETDRRRMIESIIEAEKPAHTSYNLRLEAM